MLTTVLSALTPLLLMIIAGAFSYRRNILPENSATVLNGFVYYFTLPALLFYSLGTTPFSEIAQGRFIAGYLVALIGVYGLMFLASKLAFREHFTADSIRACSASFPNSGYLGLPIMMYLYDGARQALLATTLGIILPILIVVFVVSTFALHQADKSLSRLRVVWEIVLSMIKTPLIGASFAGAVYSLLGFSIPDFLATGLRNFGMASVPCALFSVGILLAKNKMELKITNIGLVNFVKLALQPLFTAICLWFFGVKGPMLLMGIILAGMPVAALSCVLAESYNTCAAETSATFLVSMILYMPALYLTLIIAGVFGLHLPAG